MKKITAVFILLTLWAAAEECILRQGEIKGDTFLIECIDGYRWISPKYDPGREQMFHNEDGKILADECECREEEEKEKKPRKWSR